MLKREYTAELAKYTWLVHILNIYIILHTQVTSIYIRSLCYNT